MRVRHSNATSIVDTDWFDERRAWDSNPRGRSGPRPRTFQEFPVRPLRQPSRSP